MTALLAAVALGAGLVQTPDPKAPPEPALGPTVPAGSHSHFQQTCLDVQELLEKGDFAGADRLQKALPRLSFSLAWDDANVPERLRQGYSEARDQAIAAWMRGYPDSTITVVPFKKGANPAPDVVITFVDKLPQKADDPMPPGAIHFLSRDISDPRVEAVLSLQRGAPAVPADIIDVHNEVAYAFMQFYGVERSIAFGSFSARAEVSMASLSRPNTGERAQVGDNLQVCEALRTAISKKQKLIPARPKMHLEPAEVDLGRRSQGDSIRFGIQVTNLGNAPLNIRTAPDCSCVASLRVATLRAGETRLVPAQIDLTEVVGEFDRSIMVYANDLEKTATRLPVKVYSKPVYRLLPENDGMVLMPPGGVKVKVYLAIPEGVPLKALAARLDGLDADIQFKPWSGKLEDPGMNEPEMPRKGYVFDVNIADQLPPGRTRASFLVLTDHPVFKEIQTILSVQKGIIALPDFVTLGEISAVPRRAGFQLSRPRKDFEVLKATVDSPFLSVRYEPVRDKWEYRFVIQFDGRAAPGKLQATITITTNDPVQPTIKVPFSAMVK